MLRITRTLFLLSTLTLLLTACFHNRENDYLQAQAEPDLHMPAGMPNVNTNAYAVPKGAAWMPEQPANLNPPGSLAAQQADDMTPEATTAQMGTGSLGQPALLLRHPMASAMSRVEAALRAEGYQVKTRDSKNHMFLVSQEKQTLQFILTPVNQGTVIVVQAIGGTLSSSKSHELLSDLADHLS